MTANSTELNNVHEKGGYALGSGNSIPYYVPQENYLAMIAAANHYFKFKYNY